MWEKNVLISFRRTSTVSQTVKAWSNGINKRMSSRLASEREIDRDYQMNQWKMQVPLSVRTFFIEMTFKRNSQHIRNQPTNKITTTESENVNIHKNWLQTKRYCGKMSFTKQFFRKTKTRLFFSYSQPLVGKIIVLNYYLSKRISSIHSS